MRGTRYLHLRSGNSGQRICNAQLKPDDDVDAGNPEPDGICNDADNCPAIESRSD